MRVAYFAGSEEDIDSLSGKSELRSIESRKDKEGLGIKFEERHHQALGEEGSGVRFSSLNAPS